MIDPKDVKVGFEFPVPFVITRRYQEGELVEQTDKKFQPISDPRGNKWWARPKHLPDGKELLCCFD